MLVIEGPDGVGKSTLARAFARKFKAPLVCFSPLPHWWASVTYLEHTLPGAVYDRFQWSAWAYSHVAEQPWYATIENCCDIDKKLRSRCLGNYTSILLYASDLNYFDKMPVDDMFSVDKVKIVNNAFTKIIGKFTYAWDVCSASGYPNVDGFTDIARI